MRNLRHAFNSQKQRAKERGIAWDLSFDEWSTIWGDKIVNRGRRRDQLCMARLGDAGPYAVGNVKIVTTAENNRERKWTAAQRQSAADKTRDRFSHVAQRQTLSRVVKAQWADPEYRAKMIAIHGDPQRRERASVRMSEQMTNPARRKAASDAVKRRMADPVEREKQTARVRAYWARYRAEKAARAQ